MSKPTENNMSLSEKLAAYQREKDQVAAPGQEEAKKSASGASAAPGQEQEGQLFSTGTRNKDMGPNYGYQRMRLHRNEELSAYTEAQDQRYKMDPRIAKTIVMGVVTVVVFLLVCILPNDIFNPTLQGTGPAWFASTLQSNIGELFQLFTTGTSQGTYYVIIFTAIVVAFVGAALGASGACYQGALKNAMASPTTLGIMSGGTVGSVIYVFLNYSSSADTADYSTGRLGDAASLLAHMDPLSYIQFFFGQALCSLAGCFLVVGCVVLIATIAGHGKVSNTALVIAGQVIAAVSTAVIQLVRYYLTVTAPSSDALTQIVNLQNGSAATVTNIIGVLLVCVPITLCLIVVFFMRHRLNILAFNDEEARSMGISTRATRNVLVGACTLMTAIVVAFYGAVGMVGFMVPLIARRVVGSDFRYVVPASALAGACMMLLTYYVSSLGILGLDSGRGLGMFTSVVGALVFIVVIIRQRGRRNIDWV